VRKSSAKKATATAGDSINFEETFNPTPINLHPTGAPVDMVKRTLSKKAEKAGDSINFEETFNPTPINLHPTGAPVDTVRKSTSKTEAKFVDSNGDGSKSSSNLRKSA
jgi:hypothetical protein